jgi:hypothetical protein
LGVATAAVVVVLAAVFGLFKSDESSTFASRGAKEQMDVAQYSAPQTESRSSTPAAAEPTAPELHSTLQSAGEREQALVTNGPLPGQLPAEIASVNRPQSKEVDSPAPKALTLAESQPAPQTQLETLTDAKIRTDTSSIAGAPVGRARSRWAKSRCASP